MTYAPAGRAAQIIAPEGKGAVAEFDTSGNFIKQLLGGEHLASPWGLALAPSGFGQFGGDLLVGNFSFASSTASTSRTNELQWSRSAVSDISGNRSLQSRLLRVHSRTRLPPRSTISL